MTNYYDKNILSILESAGLNDRDLHKIRNILQSWVLHTDHLERLCDELDEKVLKMNRAMSMMELEYGHQLDEAEDAINKLSR